MSQSLNQSINQSIDGIYNEAFGKLLWKTAFRIAAWTSVFAVIGSGEGGRCSDQLGGYWRWIFRWKWYGFCRWNEYCEFVSSAVLARPHTLIVRAHCLTFDRCRLRRKVGTTVSDGWTFWTPNCRHSSGWDRRNYNSDNVSRTLSPLPFLHCSAVPSLFYSLNPFPAISFCNMDWSSIKEHVRTLKFYFFSSLFIIFPWIISWFFLTDFRFFSGVFLDLSVPFRRYFSDIMDAMQRQMAQMQLNMPKGATAAAR